MTSKSESVHNLKALAMSMMINCYMETDNLWCSDLNLYIIYQQTITHVFLQKYYHERTWANKI